MSERNSPSVRMPLSSREHPPKVVVPARPGSDDCVVEIMPDDDGYVFVTVRDADDDTDDEEARVAIVALSDLRCAVGVGGDMLRIVDSTLAADLAVCINALRKTSTDPVACALGQRLLAELRNSIIMADVAAKGLVAALESSP